MCENLFCFGLFDIWNGHPWHVLFAVVMHVTRTGAPFINPPLSTRIYEETQTVKCEENVSVFFACRWSFRETQASHCRCVSVVVFGWRSNVVVPWFLLKCKWASLCLKPTWWLLPFLFFFTLNVQRFLSFNTFYQLFNKKYVCYKTVTSSQYVLC